MDFTHFTAQKDDDGRRLDKIIRKLLADGDLSGLYKSIRKGLIKVDGKKSSPDAKIQEGADISVASFLLTKMQETENTLSEKNSQLENSDLVVFRNKDLLLLNKPYDSLVQPASNYSGAIVLSQLVEEDFNISHKGTSLSFKPGPLHRLDRQTSGLLAFSQSLKGARWFSEEIQQHSVKKIYIGIAQGKIQEKQRWSDFIEREQNTETLFHTVKADSQPTDSSKNANTTVQPLAYGLYENIDVTLAEFLIETGRTHQIRAQSALHGHPLLGDTAYGGRKTKPDEQNLYLHAYELRFPQNNALEMPEKINAFISTKFKKMLTKTLIKWDGNLIL